MAADWWWTPLLFAVTAGSIAVGSRYTSGKRGEEVIRAYGRLLPAFVVAICLTVFVIGPGRNSVVSLVARWMHHAGFWALFAFLLASEYLQAEARWRIRKTESAESVAATYHRLWVLTVITPAPAALMVFLTGLRLIWESPERNSLANLWLMLMVFAFGCLFFDGILGYSPVVTRLDDCWRRTAEGRLPFAAAAGALSRGVRLQLLLHTLAWPLVFALGVFRWNFPNGVSNFIASIEGMLSSLPAGWPQILVAAMLWAVTGILLFAVHIAVARLSVRVPLSQRIPPHCTDANLSANPDWRK